MFTPFWRMWEAMARVRRMCPRPKVSWEYIRILKVVGWAMRHGSLVVGVFEKMVADGSGKKPAARVTSLKKNTIVFFNKSQ
ncbi:hypothetical protein ASZ90_000714 [hydrocarbon metagenome]|uniref:Uncharacterized protein n=1 Tax=hydrocarbon metagenome TaxID=938273 RepID=A0A0W8G8B8_9ZZZZ